jgi:hypothetical protein
MMDNGSVETVPIMSSTEEGPTDQEVATMVQELLARPSTPKMKAVPNFGNPSSKGHQETTNTENGGHLASSNTERCSQNGTSVLTCLKGTSNAQDEGTSALLADLETTSIPSDEGEGSIYIGDKYIKICQQFNNMQENIQQRWRGNGNSVEVCDVTGKAIGDQESNNAPAELETKCEENITWKQLKNKDSQKVYSKELIWGIYSVAMCRGCMGCT